MKLSKETRILAVIVVWLLAGFAWVAGKIVEAHFSFAYNEAKPEAVAKASKFGWRDIEKGMSKAKVAELLGTPDVERAGTSSDAEVQGYKVEIKSQNCWVYDWAYVDPGIREGHCLYAYAVRFDQDTGLVTGKEEPEKRLSCWYWFYRRYWQRTDSGP